MRVRGLLYVTTRMVGSSFERIDISRSQVFTNGSMKGSTSIIGIYLDIEFYIGNFLGCVFYHLDPVGIVF